MAHSTLLVKPAKPYPGFPLFPHATRRWAKKIRGKLHYFGPWDDPDAALQKYLDQRDDLHAGRTPRVSADGLTVRDLCNRFLTAKQQQRDAGDITLRSFDGYFATCKTIVESFGKNRLAVDLAADDFQSLRAALAKRYGVHRVSNEVQRTRTVFKYGYEAGLFENPVRFGPTFKRPSNRVMRAHRQKNGVRMFEAADLRTILDNAAQPLRAMIFLGINCAFGNNDCGTLPKVALDLNGGWVNYPRPKTAIERRCPLWPETVEAIRVAISRRTQPKSPEHGDLVFLTKYGLPWAKETSDNPVSNEMRKLLDGLGLYRQGLGFYCLRHTFQTVGEEAGETACRFIMGHADPSMAAHYRERIGDDRLRGVVDHVRGWLFGIGETK